MIMGKRSIVDLGKNATPVTAKMRAAGQLALSKTIVKMRDDFDRAKASPQWIAMEKLEAALKALRADPAINVSEPCSDLLDMTIGLLDQAWPHHPFEDIVQPLQKHFDSLKARQANGGKQRKIEAMRQMHYDFLDVQNIKLTNNLAARLRQTFKDLTIRGSNDTVRSWKKLRSTGKA